MEAANNLLKNFCQSIGMSPLGFDEEKQRSLAFDDKVVLSFLGNENDDNLIAIAFIGEVKKDADLRIFMEQNFIADAHGGARYSLEPKSNRIVMSRAWNAIKTTVEELSDDLEAYINSAIRAQEFLANGGIVETAQEPSDGAPANTSLNAYESL